MRYTTKLIQKYDAKSEAKISELIDPMQDKIRAFRSAAFHELGLLILVYSAYRDFLSQWDLRLKFLEDPKAAQAAAPGYSWHNFRRAVDYVVIMPDGKADWEFKKGKKLAALAERIGLQSGRKFGDNPHLYFPDGTRMSTERAINPGWQIYALKEADIEEKKNNLKPSPGSPKKDQTDVTSV